MTEILTISPQSETNFGSTTSRRSYSHTSLLYQNQAPYSGSSLKSGPYMHTSALYDTKSSVSLPSSAPSSPRSHPPDFSNLPSYLSTPSSSLSLDEHCGLDDDDDDAILFPSYDDPPEESEPPPSPNLSPEEDLDVTPPTQERSSLCRFDKFDASTSAADDIAAKVEPSRHVDYLSHDWKEEDIWSSWRHIVGKRNAYKERPYLENASWTRLENASWRTWAKTMHRLKTVSPERLNWMKDHDVTWLYGPLQTGRSQGIYPERRSSTNHLSRTNSFATKKPILKKRSLSEMMLQRSISTSTLMKQAVDALRAQQQPVEGLRLRPTLNARAYSDYISTYTPTTPAAASTPSVHASSSSSGLQTPSDRRHIHFNDKVEQCIAINKEVDDDFNVPHDDSDSDDGIIMMRPVHEKAQKLSRRANSARGSFSNESKIIAMLPSTTLRGATPEPPEPEAKQNFGSIWNAATRLVTSSSQETLKPSKPSSNFLLDDDDEEADMTWQPTASSSRRNGTAYIGQSSESYEEDDEMEGRGMRRTASGMFMPYEEDEDDVVAAGLFGKVFDTVNTAKDIAHVIWNVGWRR